MKIIDYLKLNLPFSYIWIIRSITNSKFKTVLDLGCDRGDFMKVISRGRRWKIIGIELYEDSIKEAKKSGIYQQVIKGDITKLPRRVRKKKYDLVFCSQVLEHLPKNKGKKALKEWEELADKRIVVSTPRGFIPYERIEVQREEKNPHQKHLSGWQIREFTDRDYQVRGQGVTFIYGKNGIARGLPSLLPFLSLVSIIFAPLVYFFPQLSTYMITWKDK